jgi:uncharacterized protein
MGGTEGRQRRQPSPPVFNTFLVKIASRCNIDCDYCYMYHSADQSWQRRPRFMSEDTMNALFERAAGYARLMALPHVTFLLHGGEPLLAGMSRIEKFVSGVRSTFDRLAPETRLEFSMQTNGTLLTSQWLTLFDRIGLTFGVSLDGDQIANDRHRLDHKGRSSFSRVKAALSMIEAHPFGKQTFRGLLGVMDLRNDPLETFRFLADLNPPRLDFLFPEGTHDNLPPFVSAGTSNYANWLIPIFDEWFEGGSRVRLRLFENLIDVLLGGRSQTEGTGEGHLNLLTIETDGEIEDVDLMKVTYEGGGRFVRFGPAPTVHSLGFQELAESTGAQERHRLHTLEGLSETCRQCPAAKACGGGFLPHRWSSERGFDNPSVYCRDLLKLIQHIQGRLKESLVSLSSAGVVSPVHVSL